MNVEKIAVTITMDTSVLTMHEGIALEATKRAQELQIISILPWQEYDVTVMWMNTVRVDVGVDDFFQAESIEETVKEGLLEMQWVYIAEYDTLSSEDVARFHALIENPFERNVQPQDPAWLDVEAGYFPPDKKRMLYGDDDREFIIKIATLISMVGYSEMRKYGVVDSTAAERIVEMVSRPVGGLESPNLLTMGVRPFKAFAGEWLNHNVPVALVEDADEE